MAQGAAGIGGRAEVEVVYPHVGCELEAALGRQALVVPVEHKVAQPSAWLSGGLFQPQIVLQAAPSFIQPRPISPWVRAGLRACCRHSVVRERLVDVGVVTGDRRPQHGAALDRGHREVEVGEARAAPRLRGGQIHEEGIDARPLQSVGSSKDKRPALCME
eukprot:scaffold17507_cov60-Phaeocystis_antarctica.AAC.2